MNTQDQDATVNRLAIELDESPGMIRYWLLNGIPIRRRPYTLNYKGGCGYCHFEHKCTNKRLYLNDEGMPCETLLPFEKRAISIGGFEQ